MLLDGKYPTFSMTSLKLHMEYILQFPVLNPVGPPCMEWGQPVGRKEHISIGSDLEGGKEWFCGQLGDAAAATSP